MKKTNNYKNMYAGKLLDDDTPFAINEAFRTLRTNLSYTSGGDSCPVYAITSCFSGSGKSLTISNLAISFAKLNKKVLLIDCDLRKSVIHKIFGIERGFGLSELLAGSDNSVDKCLRKTSYDNLQIITAGGTPPNPTELLASDRMGKLIEFLKKHFDIILLDAPPIGVVTDATVLCELVTGYLFLIRSGKDDQRNLAYSVSVMEQVKANIVGFVLNDIDVKSGGKYGYGRYYGKYGNYYGKYGY